MQLNGKNVICLTWKAEAYYSGRVGMVLWFISEDMYEKHEEDITDFNIYFQDLDGKHSELMGEMEIHTEDTAIGKVYDMWAGDYDKVRDRIMELEDSAEMDQFNDDVLNALDFTKKTVVTFNGRVIYES